MKRPLADSKSKVKEKSLLKVGFMTQYKMTPVNVISLFNFHVLALWALSLMQRKKKKNT